MKAVTLLLHCAIAGVVALATVSAAVDVSRCGVFESTCGQTTFQNYYVEAGLITSGISRSDFDWNRNFYNTTAPGENATATCNAEDLVLTIDAIGTWIDLGPNADIQGAENWQMNFDYFKVRPYTQEMTNYLNDACPCGADWVVNISRTLDQCDADQCKNTTFLGGSVAGPNGIIIGQPAYGWTKADGNNLQISQLDAAYLAGFSVAVDALADLEENKLPCNKAKSSNNVCGAWKGDCSPLLGQTPQAVQSAFNYQGDAKTAGLYVWNHTFYDDNSCTNLFMEVSETGSLVVDHPSLAVQDGYAVAKRAPAVTVTPRSKQAVTMLQDFCPCGQSNIWKVGQPFRLTDCDQGTCDINLPGMTAQGGDAFAGMQRLDIEGSGVHELRFSYFSPDDAQGWSSNLTATNFAMTQDDDKTCLYPSQSTNIICGLYQQQCSAADNNQDVIIEIEAQGVADSAAQGQGSFTKTMTYYQPGTNCDKKQMTLDIQFEGYWSDFGADIDLQGARQVYITYPTLTVVAKSSLDVNILNNPKIGCPCGGVWESGVPRVLESCTQYSCPRSDFFGPAAFGKPGFGILRVAEGKLRITELQHKSSDGFASKFSVDDFAIPLTDACSPVEPDDDFPGLYMQVCRPDPLAPVDQDLDVTGYFTYGNGYYALNQTKYVSGHGCNAQPALSLAHNGQMFVKGPSQTIEDAYDLQLRVDNLQVTPHTDDMTNYLATACPCSTSGSIWTKDATASISKCPDGTCQDTTWLRMPPTTNVYGSLVKTDSFLLMSQMTDDPTTGYPKGFTSKDLSWLRIDHAPAPKGSSGHELSAGDILLILFFVGIATYIALGVSWNLSTKGRPDLPNVEFWKGLPGLIKDGFNYSVMGCFGMRGYDVASRPVYSAMNNDTEEASVEGYGAL